MKALTIWQPWATLIALGHKKIETRGWHTNHRGPIAIHAATRPLGPEERAYLDHLREHVGLALPDASDLPLGAVVATANLYDCLQMSDEYVSRLNRLERILGDHRPGRYAWRLTDTQLLHPPVLARGAQRLWEWREP